MSPSCGQPQRAQYRRLRAAILRVLSLALPIYSGTFVIIAAFQAVGRTRKPSASASSDVGRWTRSYSSSSAALGGGIEVVWATSMTDSFGLVVWGVRLLRVSWTWIDA